MIKIYIYFRGYPHILISTIMATALRGYAITETAFESRNKLPHIIWIRFLGLSLDYNLPYNVIIRSCLEKESKYSSMLLSTGDLPKTKE